MIKSLKITNFKSIVDAEVELGKFNVLIGANGSGKSNFVKSLEFISDIPELGVAEAVRKNGGFDSLLSKVRTSQKEKKMSFEVEAEIPSPTVDLQPLKVFHFVELSKHRTEPVRVVQERIRYENVLAVGRYAVKQEKESAATVIVPDNSYFEVLHSLEDKLSIELGPESKDYEKYYLYWLGLEFLERFNKRGIRKLIEAVSMGRRSARENNLKYLSLIDPSFDGPLRFSRYADMYKTMLQRLTRYDFQISDLRTERATSTQRQLDKTGANLPSVLRLVLKDPTAKQRIMTTLESISPAIKGLRTNTLKSGKQYVEFIESGVKRVESWNASDGALRVLAILLALESHPTRSTLVIEEPELNLHPWAIQPIVSHMREVIEEKDVQIIVTTHSQQLLEIVEPDEVWVASRSQSDGTHIAPIRKIAPSSKILKGELGQMWVRGLLGGVPEYD